MFIAVSVRKNLKSSVTFSRFTFLNQRTKEETDIGSNEDNKTFQPGQIDLIAVENPWPVPSQPGSHELRIYSEDRVLASAAFRVE